MKIEWFHTFFEDGIKKEKKNVIKPPLKKSKTSEETAEDRKTSVWYATVYLALCFIRLKKEF